MNFYKKYYRKPIIMPHFTFNLKFKSLLFLISDNDEDKRNKEAANIFEFQCHRGKLNP